VSIYTSPCTECNSQFIWLTRLPSLKLYENKSLKHKLMLTFSLVFLSSFNSIQTISHSINKEEEAKHPKYAHSDQANNCSVQAIPSLKCFNFIHQLSDTILQTWYSRFSVLVCIFSQYSAVRYDLSIFSHCLECPNLCIPVLFEYHCAFNTHDCAYQHGS
jgi:hypothetical protein